MARSKEEIAFQKKLTELVKRAQNLENAEVAKVITLLAQARETVAAKVATTEWQAYRLPEFKNAIDRSLQEFGTKYGVDLRETQRSFWEDGINMVMRRSARLGSTRPCRRSTQRFWGSCRAMAPIWFRDWPRTPRSGSITRLQWD